MAGAARFGSESSPFLIAGPCVVESDELNVRIGEALAELSVKLGIGIIYKASYDKANRSRLNAPRGPGLETGLRALEKVRSATGLPILTDVHEPGHVPLAARVAGAGGDAWRRGEGARRRCSRGRGDGAWYVLRLR